MGSFLPRSGFIFIQIGFWEGHGLSSQIKEPREKKKNRLYRSTRSRSVHHRVAELIYSHLLPLRYSRLTEYMLSLQFPSVDFTESTHSRLNFPQCQLGSLKWKFAEKILTLSALLSVRPSVRSGGAARTLYKNYILRSHCITMEQLILFMAIFLSILKTEPVI